MKKNFLMGCMLMLAVMHGGWGQVTVNYDAQEPVAEVIMSNPLPAKEDFAGNAWRWREGGTGARSDVGQLFKSDKAFKLSGVVLYTLGASVSEQGRPFKLIIEKFLGDGLNSGREEISSQDGLLPHLGMGNRYIYFLLQEPVEIEAEEVYGFRLQFEEEAPENSVGIVLDNKRMNLPFGEFFYYYNPSFSSELVQIPTQSAVFYILGEE